MSSCSADSAVAARDSVAVIAGLTARTTAECILSATSWVGVISTLLKPAAAKCLWMVAANRPVRLRHRIVPLEILDRNAPLMVREAACRTSRAANLDPKSQARFRARPSEKSTSPAWKAQLQWKGVGGQMEARLADAEEDGDVDAVAELRNAERYADAGYQTDLATPLENQAVTNPDLDAQFPGAGLPGNQTVKVEIKQRSASEMTLGSLGDDVDRANRQIKNAKPDGTGRGDIIVDATTAPAKMTVEEVEAFLKGKIKGEPLARLRQIEYLAVVYRKLSTTTSIDPLCCGPQTTK